MEKKETEEQPAPLGGPVTRETVVEMGGTARPVDQVILERQEPTGSPDKEERRALAVSPGASETRDHQGLMELKEIKVMVA